MTETDYLVEDMRIKEIKKEIEVEEEKKKKYFESIGGRYNIYF